LGIVRRVSVRDQRSITVWIMLLAGVLIGVWWTRATMPDLIGPVDEKACADWRTAASWFGSHDASGMQTGAALFRADALTARDPRLATVLGKLALSLEHSDVPGFLTASEAMFTACRSRS
jgi:hypothetical protein